MAEIPDHLLKRAAERKAALEAKKAEEAPGAGGAASVAGPEAPGGSDAAGGTATPSDPSGKIPDALLERSAAAKAARAAAGGGGGTGAGGAGEGQPGAGGGVATKEAPAATAAAARVTGGGTGGAVAGAAGHTQRLLTVVKAGSIQDVKSVPTDKVHVWPHLLVSEFVAALGMTSFLLVFATFVNAPLLGAANYNLTPNPSKAPWYFLGLQELLTMFHPMVAGVAIPGVGLAGLAVAGYIDRNPSHKPEDRKFAIAIFTFFLMFWASLVIIGCFFRGEGFNFILPWRQGVHDIFEL